MARFLRTGEGPVIGRRIEVEGLTQQGLRIPVELAISPMTLEGVSHFTAYLWDISAPKAAEAALRQSDERLRATYEHAFVGIGEADTAGRIIRANELFGAITGYTRDELLSRAIWDVTHPDDAKKEKELYARQMRAKLLQEPEDALGTRVVQVVDDDHRPVLSFCASRQIGGPP